MGRVVSGVLSVGGLFSKGLFAGSFSWLGLGVLGAEMLLGSKNTNGARLTDLAVQNAQEGAPLPRGWGTWRQAGNLVWSTGLIEHKKKQRSGGKGGPTTTTFSYSTSFLSLCGRGPISRINRIKLDATVFYDWNGGAEKGFTLTQDASDGHLYATKNGVSLRIYLGTANQKVSPTIEAKNGVGKAVAYANCWGIEIDDLPLEKYGNRVPNATFEVYYSVTDLPSIVTEICGWVGLASTDLDLSDLSGISVAPTAKEGFVIGSQRTAASALQELMMAYSFDLPEVDGVLRAVRRGKSAASVLVPLDLRIHTPADAMPGAMWQQTDETELPAIQEVQTYDPARDFNPGYRYARRQNTLSNKRDSQSFGMSMTGARAERTARILSLEKWSQAERYPITMGLKHLWLAPADVIQIPTPDGVRNVSLPEITTPLFGALAVNAPVSDGLIYTIAMPPNTAGLDIGSVVEAGAPIVFAASLVPLRNNNPDMVSKAGFLVATCPTTGSTSGIDLKITRDIGSGQTQIMTQKTLSGNVVVGYTNAAFALGSTTAYDAGRSLSVTLYGGGLNGTTTAQLANGANLLAFETGRIISFQNATQTSGLTYTIDTIKDGGFGSDYDSATIPSGTQILLLTDSEGQYDLDIAWIDNSNNYDASALIIKATSRDNATLSTTRGIASANNNLVPISPSSVTLTRNVGVDATIAGQTRTRYAGNATWFEAIPGNLTDPLNFRITFDGSVIVSTRTASTSAFSFVFTDAQLTTIFGGGTIPTTLTGTISQVGSSGLVGHPRAFSQ